MGRIEYDYDVFTCFQQNHGLQIDYTESFYVGGLFSFLRDVGVQKSFISAWPDRGLTVA